MGSFLVHRLLPPSIDFGYAFLFSVLVPLYDTPPLYCFVLWAALSTPLFFSPLPPTFTRHNRSNRKSSTFSFGLSLCRLLPRRRSGTFLSYRFVWVFHAPFDQLIFIFHSLIPCGWGSLSSPPGLFRLSWRVVFFVPFSKLFPFFPSDLFVVFVPFFSFNSFLHLTQELTVQTTKLRPFSFFFAYHSASFCSRILFDECHPPPPPLVHCFSFCNSQLSPVLLLDAPSPAPSSRLPLFPGGLALLPPCSSLSLPVGNNYLFSRPPRLLPQILFVPPRNLLCLFF